MRFVTEKRLANFLWFLAILTFLAAWFGEILVDVRVLPQLERGEIMNVAIPLTFNFVLVGAAVDGEIATRNRRLSRHDAPVKFWLLIGTALLILNAIFALQIWTAWFAR